MKLGYDIYHIALSYYENRAMDDFSYLDNLHIQ